MRLFEALNVIGLPNTQPPSGLTYFVIQRLQVGANFIENLIGSPEPYVIPKALCTFFIRQMWKINPLACSTEPRQCSVLIAICQHE